MAFLFRFNTDSTSNWFLDSDEETPTSKKGKAKVDDSDGDEGEDRKKGKPHPHTSSHNLWFIPAVKSGFYTISFSNNWSR